MGGRRQHRRGRHLLLTVAALSSLIVGYYLGQHWQRRPLAEVSAIVYPAGRPIDYPADLGIADDDAGQHQHLARALRDAPGLPGR